MRYLLILLFSAQAFAGSNNLPIETHRVIQYQDVNKFQQALSGDQFPRDNTGVVASLSASLGTFATQFLKIFVASGGFTVGDMKAHYDFAGAQPIGEGWMLCDGRTVTQANYDTEHGSGHWTTYVGSSPILNLHLPDMVNSGAGRFPVGAAVGSTQSGASAITATGNASNVVNLSHTHTVNAHNHQWLGFGGGGTSDNSFNSSGNPVFWNGSDTRGIQNNDTNGAAGTITGLNFGDAYTANASPGTSSGGSSSQNIEPDSIKVLYYLRVIQ